MNGMEPAFGEAYGGHRGLLSPYPLAMSPQGGRTEYDQVRQQVTSKIAHSETFFAIAIELNAT